MSLYTEQMAFLATVATSTGHDSGDEDGCTPADRRDLLVIRYKLKEARFFFAYARMRK